MCQSRPNAAQQKARLYFVTSSMAKCLPRASFAQGLLNSLSSEAISSVPELASRRPSPWVVDTFLVRTANYCVSHRDREHSVLLDKFQYLPGDVDVGTDVTAVHLPVAYLLRFRILGWHDTNSDLRCRVRLDR